MIVLIFLLAVTVVFSIPLIPIPKTLTPPTNFNATALQEYLELAQYLQDEVDPKDGLIPCWEYKSWTGEPYLTESIYEYCTYVLSNNKKSYFLEGYEPEEDDLEGEEQNVDIAFQQPGMLYTHFAVDHSYIRAGWQLHKFYCRTPACNIPSSLRMFEVFQKEFDQLNKEKR